MLRIGLIGAGRWGMNHLRTASEVFDPSHGRMPGVEIAAIADPNRRTWDAAKKFAPNARYYASSQDLLDDKSIDAVIVAAPSELHVTLATRALLAGKNVLIEKPGAFAVGGAQELERLAKRKNRIAMVAHLATYDFLYRKAAALLQQGVCGRPRRIKIVRESSQRNPVGDDALWGLAVHDVAWIVDGVAHDAITERISNIRVDHNNVLTGANLRFVAMMSGNLFAGAPVQIDLSFSRGIDAPQRSVLIEGDQGWIELDGNANVIGYEGAESQNSWSAADEDTPMANQVVHFAMCSMMQVEPRTGMKHLAEVTKILAHCHAWIEPQKHSGDFWVDTVRKRLPVGLL